MAAATSQIEQMNHRNFREAIKSLSKALKSEYEGKLFYANRIWLITGVVLSVVAVVGAIASLGHERLTNSSAILFFLDVWRFAVIALAKQVAASWVQVRRGEMVHLVAAIVFTLVSMPFFAVEVFMVPIVARATFWWIVPVGALMLVANVVFFKLMKRAMVARHGIMDSIEGFRMHLKTDLGDELRSMKAPKKTPERFERFLPYAVAMEVENDWADQFDDALLAASVDQGDGCQPTWYRGSAFTTAAIGNAVCGLSAGMGSALESASTSPNSGGSGGDGSSGGGGGVGGW